MNADGAHRFIQMRTVRWRLWSIYYISVIFSVVFWCVLVCTYVANNEHYGISSAHNVFIKYEVDVFPHNTWYTFFYPTTAALDSRVRPCLSVYGKQINHNAKIIEILRVFVRLISTNVCSCSEHNRGKCEKVACKSFPMMSEFYVEPTKSHLPLVNRQKKHTVAVCRSTSHADDLVGASDSMPNLSWPYYIHI